MKNWGGKSRKKRGKGREEMKRFGVEICFYIINNVYLPRRWCAWAAGD